MKLDWLESFAVFAEELNFTRAARRLHLSQPALHVQVRKLAEHLGCPLYTRAGRSLRLTAEGRRAETLARDVLDRAAVLPEAVRSGTDEAPITLCAGEPLQALEQSQIACRGVG